jgi:hypothetical protein
MKKTHVSNQSMGQINKKVLDTLGAKKPLITKTIFKLEPQWDSFLRSLAKVSKLTIREFLDTLANVTEQAHAKGELPEFTPSHEGKRMSYAISENAKEVFERLACERNIPRDNLVQSGIVYLYNILQKFALPTKKKIEYAKILLKARDEMLQIYNSEKVAEARKSLSNCGDEDFSDCDEKFSDIDQLLHDIDLVSFIKRKEDETNKSRN